MLHSDSKSTALTVEFAVGEGKLSLAKAVKSSGNKNKSTGGKSTGGTASKSTDSLLWLDDLAKETQADVAIATKAIKTGNCETNKDATVGGETAHKKRCTKQQGGRGHGATADDMSVEKGSIGDSDGFVASNFGDC